MVATSRAVLEQRCSGLLALVWVQVAAKPAVVVVGVERVSAVQVQVEESEEPEMQTEAVSLLEVTRQRVERCSRGSSPINLVASSTIRGKAEGPRGLPGGAKCLQTRK